MLPYWSMYDLDQESYIRLTSNLSDINVDAHFRREEVNFWATVATELRTAHEREPDVEYCDPTSSGGPTVALSIIIASVSALVQLM